MEEVRQQQRIHRDVLDGIARLEDPHYREQRHTLLVVGHETYTPPVDRRSWEHLVDFLDNNNKGSDGEHEDDSHDDVRITELALHYVKLPQPSDGGLDVLRDFFARSDDMTLTKVFLQGCNFGAAEEASQRLAAFHTNRSVTDFSIQRISNLEGAALGASLAGLLRNMPQLQRLYCYDNHLRADGIRALQSTLRANRTLKQLGLVACDIGADGIRLIADALVGNTAMERVNVSLNSITSVGLADITRLLHSTQLKTITLWRNNALFNDDGATKHFVTTLQHTLSTLQELPWIHENAFPDSSKVTTFASIKNSLTRNQQLNRLNLLLLAPSLPPLLLQRQHQTTIMMLKISHKAITKFATVRSNAGASAIFKLFTSRPQLLEKRIKRRAAV
jgi:hypothetical protein